MDANSIADVLDLVSRALRQYAATSSPTHAAPSVTDTTVAQWAVTYAALVSDQGLKAQTEGSQRRSGKCPNPSHQQDEHGRTYCGLDRPETIVDA